MWMKKLLIEIKKRAILKLSYKVRERAMFEVVTVLI